MATPLTDVLEGRHPAGVMLGVTNSLLSLGKYRLIVDDKLPPMIDDALLALEGGDIELAQVILERMRETLLGAGHTPG